MFATSSLPPRSRGTKWSAVGGLSSLNGFPQIQHTSALDLTMMRLFPYVRSRGARACSGHRVPRSTTRPHEQLRLGKEKGRRDGRP